MKSRARCYRAFLQLLAILGDFAIDTLTFLVLVISGLPFRLDEA